MKKDMDQIIREKRDGGAHSDETIATLIDQYMKNVISDEAMAAWLMAVYLNGMNKSETAALTNEMVASGRQLSWPDALRKKFLLVDKHSSGGVGDKTTLIVAPIVASLGIPVVKLSGRGLGHTGGTIDKLESVSGLHTDFGRKDIFKQMEKTGLYIGAQTVDLAPADGRIYALRNKTATIESIPLITSSILSKKIAGGADGFVFDIKAGNGAFMKTVSDAKALAASMSEICRTVGKKCSVIVSDMNQPLGYAIGNALEVQEALTLLKGIYADARLETLSLVLAAHMIHLATDWPLDVCKEKAGTQLQNGEAYATFVDMLRAQGGEIESIIDEETEFNYDFYSEQTGVITAMDCAAIGRVAKQLGAGVFDGKSIDPLAGIIMHKKIGDAVFAGERIAQLRYEISRAAYIQETVADLYRAIQIETNGTGEVSTTEEDVIIEILPLL